MIFVTYNRMSYQRVTYIISSIYMYNFIIKAQNSNCRWSFAVGVQGLLRKHDEKTTGSPRGEVNR